MNESAGDICDEFQSSCGPSLFTGLTVAYITAELVIAVLSTVGNILVCVAVTRNRKLRTVTNYFLVSLAVADIFVGTLAIPCAVLTDLGMPRHDLPLCLILLSVLIVLTQCSILSLLAVAVDRYVAILLPFQYQRIMSPRNAWVALFLTWGLALLSGAIPLMGWHGSLPSSGACWFPCVVNMSYMVYFNFIGCVLAPLVVMFIIYGHIFLTVRRQLRRIAAERGPVGPDFRNDQSVAGSSDVGSSAGSKDDGSGSGGGAAGPGGARAQAAEATSGRVPSGGECRAAACRRGEVRKATSLFLLVFLFMLCWLPIHCVNCVALLRPGWHIPKPLSLAAILLSHANSALNPLLYAYRMRSFRHTLGNLCRARTS